MRENKIKKEALALRYDSEESGAPRVTAKGQGYIAERILENAEEAGVPVQEDPTLLSLLSEININEEIPEELYLAVAEVFAFIYRSDREMKNRNDSI
ncbi:EscU/YscU/HrcU family type III secretion system export apparatus switch protein [Salimicrobium jeotgali]|uniref:EscU/YscU/HrcU family type III secretion system export apparatus switch protein n=1 Tax=Salimicrobium jeotgali TaxID=1230341 RepID=UPI000C8441F1|nr:EscU/YscU/HrcU family type III secretion system export apparatus switch protein [Salimicrobium jeotgali]